MNHSDFCAFCVMEKRPINEYTEARALNTFLLISPKLQIERHLEYLGKPKISKFKEKFFKIAPHILLFPLTIIETSIFIALLYAIELIPFIDKIFNLSRFDDRETNL